MGGEVSVEHAADVMTLKEQVQQVQQQVQEQHDQAAMSNAQEDKQAATLRQALQQL